MANPAHLEKLCQGPKAWNAWREANPHIVPDLTDIQLTLHQRQLGPSNGGPIDFRGANMEGAVLRYATLSAADFEGARLNGADLTHARLDGAKLNGADLADALLDQADLTGALLDQAVLFGADLTNTRNLTLAQLEPAYGDTSTRLPGNLLPPAGWFPDVLDDEFYGDTAWDMDDYEEPPTQNLYEVLGLTPQAPVEDIRSAYRNLVKKLHPDLNPNDQAAQDRFKIVTLANRILSDPEQRGRYDRGEIDSEGRVNPEFEARRQFRRTATRYYAAAVVSFLFAAGVLAAVWHTVLSLDPAWEPAPQAAALSQPKSSERLGEAPTKPETAQRNAALFTEGPENARPGAFPAEPEQAAPQVMPEPSIESAGQKPSLEPLPTERQAAPSEQAPTPPETETPSTPVAGESSNASEQASQLERADEQTAQQSAPPPSIEPSPQAAQSAAGASSGENALAKPLPPTPDQAGVTPRPLRERHKSEAGQTTPSAPDRWSVAAIPQIQNEPERQTQPGANAREQPVIAGPMSPMARKPAAQDMVSKVLRNRAIRQTLGSSVPQAIARSGATPVPERRAGVTADFPTNALPSKPRTPPVQRTAATQPKPTGARPPAEPNGASNDAPVSSAVVAPQAPARQVRHHEAVSDILSGGM